MYLRIAFLLIPLLASLPSMAAPWDDAISEAKRQDLPHQKQWLKLLHYRKALFGGWKSQADGMKFFLSPEGKTDPQAELDSDIRAFFSTAPLAEKEQHPQCQFPARFKWLNRELGLSKRGLPHPDCSKYRQFRENVAAKSTSVVFSSYYLNNPASAFGHSLLRFNKAPMAYAGRRYELLDYGISYAASVTISNPILYAIYGVFGLFPGQFTSVPYYYKVREYNDYESRDLWEYDLSLSEDQTDMALAHVWELGSTYFDYFYLTENCSYHVLSIIEAGAPELELVDKLPMIVIPADTMRILAKAPGLVREIRYRASGRVQFARRIENLSARQIEELNTLISRRGFESKDAGVLDAAMDYVDFRYSQHLIEPDSPDSQWKQKLLSSRSRLPEQTPELVIEAPKREMPHLGHESARIGLDYGYGNQTKEMVRLQGRIALHDLLDPVPGYPEFAQIEFLSTRLRYNFQPKKFWLEDFALLRVVSLSPVSSFNRQPSWRFRIGAHTVRDASCQGCLAGDLALGGGYTFGPYKGVPITLTPMLEASLAGAPGFDRFFVRPGAGPTVLMRIAFNDRLTALLHGSYQYRVPTVHHHYFEYGVETRAGLLKDFSLNLKIIRYPDLSKVYGEYSFGAMYYF